MPYADQLRVLFPTLEPKVTDLFALEAHQIADLPSRAPARELAEVLHVYPEVRAFLQVRYPPIADYLTRLLAEHAPADPADLAASEQALLWEIGDFIAYDTAPQIYDAASVHAWGFEAVTDVVDLDDKVVIDAGAGSGKVAFEALSRARHVFAVEPVARLRQFMREKAAASDIDNLFVLDGVLDAIPLPADTADVLLTCRAIGWSLEEELAEIERVVKPGGVALHLGFPHPPPDGDVLHLRLTEAGYVFATYEDGQGRRRSYRKQL